MDEKLVTLKDPMKFIRKYKSSWAIAFSSFEVEKKTERKIIYALFDKKKLKQAHMILNLDPKGRLLNLILDPVSK